MMPHPPREARQNGISPEQSINLTLSVVDSGLMVN
jgi:hypothetical protein